MSKLPFANKELGQHFLRDQKVIDSITSDWTSECDAIIEIGPGPAILSRNLANIGKPYYVIEKDSRFKELLLEIMPEDNILITDALKVDWQQYLAQRKLKDKKIWLVSNLPYNVGTVLFTQFLQISNIQYMTLMFQKEVGDKTYMREEKNSMNGLLFLSLNYFNSKRLLKVAPGCFAPPPKVDSVVVSYDRKLDPEISTKDFSKLNHFTRLLFSMKRKQIQSVLKSAYPIEKISIALDLCNIESNLRAETLNFKQVRELFKALN